MGVTRYCREYCLSFGFYEQLQLPFLTNLTDGVVPHTSKIFDS